MIHQLHFAFQLILNGSQELSAKIFPVSHRDWNLLDKVELGVRPESTVPRYRADGNGRDLYRIEDLEKPPITGVLFVKNKIEPKPKKLLTGAITGSTAALPRFVPNGTGRDLFQQCNPTPLVAHTGTMFSTHPPVHSNKGLGVNRLDRPAPLYRPNGTGRDLFYTDKNTTAVPTLRKEIYRKPPQARTAPLPRFKPTGTGRDTYQNLASDDDASMCSSTTSLFYSAPKPTGFAYGSESITRSSQSAQQRVMKLYNDRMGTTVHSSSQKTSMERLSTSPQRDRTRYLRAESPMQFSPIQTRTGLSSPFSLRG
eukprot:gene13023-27476_t